MTEKFKDKIREYQRDNKIIFYNTSGSTDAYKMNLKHLSTGAMFKVGNIKNGILKTNQKVFIADLEREKIIEVEGEIHIVKLE